MKIISPAFKDGEMLPEKYTPFGENISPPFKFRKIPKDAVKLNLTCEDKYNIIDNKLAVHWSVWFENKFTEIPNNFAYRKRYHNIKQKPNSWNNKNYEGPNPTEGSGIHHYNFILVAFNKEEKIIEKTKIDCIFERK